MSGAITKSKLQFRVKRLTSTNLSSSNDSPQSASIEQSISVCYLLQNFKQQRDWKPQSSTKLLSLSNWTRWLPWARVIGWETDSKIEIKLDRVGLSSTSRPGPAPWWPVAAGKPWRRQLQDTIQDLQLTIEAQRQAAARIVEQARLEAARLQAEESAFRRTITRKGHGHGLAR